MAFNPQTINKELDMANLAKHNANYSAIKTELDAHDTHVATQTAHGSTSAASAGKIMQRDSAGRAKVAAPSASDDIARKAEVDVVQTNLTTHAADAVAHLTSAEHTKLTGIAVGAEVNQNAFAQVNNVPAGSKTDTLTIEGGIGITVSTDVATKKVTVTATGTAAPGAHASTHISGGSDEIPNAVVGGASGLMSGTDAEFVRVSGETKAGAQAKADAAVGTATDYAKSYGIGVSPSTVANANSLPLASGSGFYTVTSATANIPVAADGALIHIGRDSRPSQIVCFHLSGRMFYRGYTSTGWLPWGEIPVESNGSTTLQRLNLGVGKITTPADYLDIEFPSATSAGVNVRLFRATTTTGNRELLLNKGDGSGAVDFRIQNGKIISLAGVNVSILAGVGSPEGVQTAPIGSLYLRSDGGASTTLYVKQSGTGNTGWVAK